MIGGRMSPGVLGTCATLFVLVQAGPLLRFPRESEDYPNPDFSNYTANEVCFSDQKVFQRGEEVPNAGPCEECRCEPPSIVCQMLKCPVNNNGCRTIQRPNHCCPDYNCECDYNGQLYNDGERIDLPEDPCQVCYCKGGDVMCTSITCYQRDDCEPKHVPGQCCPKYEDCPIRDMEASNTEDKNVQTRSPNKTMNSNPKKEMQPWLLTKSVPQTSSSLAMPKLGETTTDSGNVIIVSDWLVERKTTEDFHTKQTEDPDFSTHREFITTILPQKPTQNNEKEISLEKTMQTVKPTPVDEVVFTRIDVLKRVQEEINDLITTTSSTKIEGNNSFVVNLPEMITNSKILSENTTSNLPLNDSNKLLQDNLTGITKTDNENSSTLNAGSETRIITTMSPTGEILLTQTSAITKNAPIKVEPTKDYDVFETSTPEYFEVEIMENRFNDTEAKVENQQKNESKKLIEHFEGTKNLSQSVKVLSDEDKPPVEMSLEHLFGFYELEEGTQSTAEISLSTEKENAEKKDIHNFYTTFPAEIELPFKVTGSKDASLLIKKEPMIENVKLDGINHIISNDLSKGENSSHLYELLTTTETYDEEETTTSLTSELNIKKQPLQSGKSENESDENYEETTYLPETTTQIGTSTLLAVSIPKLLNDEAKENVLENLVEGKPEDEADFNADLDSTTPSTTEKSGYTDPVSTESNNPLTTQGFQENHNNNIQEESSHIYISKVNTFKDSTFNSDHEETTKNSLSEIEIILGETSDTDVMDKSISSKESNEQDEVVLDLALDQFSSENKEVIHANHPPVLELNSHVPFLQIGGDGNSESSDTEYDQTTIANSQDILQNFNSKAVHRNKDIIKLIQSEDTSNSSFTVTPSRIETLSSTEEPNSKPIEEFTIPTIAVVPLTPGDLKMIAEYLISEKIKPASLNNSSMYSRNKWLQGNLTSAENIASILSAANVSIGLMNETNMGRKLETFNKSNENVRFEKFEKETHYKSNSLQENKKGITSKIGYLHDKNSDNQENFKTTIPSPEKTNNGRITTEHFPTGATGNSIGTATTPPLKKVSNGPEQDIQNFKNLDTESTPSEINNKVGIDSNKSDISLKSDDKDSSKTVTADSYNITVEVINQLTAKLSMNNEQNETTTEDNINLHIGNLDVHKAENLVTREPTIDEGTTQTTSRLLATYEEPFISSNTNKANYKVLNKLTTKLFNDDQQNKTTSVDNINEVLESEHKTDNPIKIKKEVNQESIQMTSRL